VAENRLLKRMLGPKEEDVRTEKYANEELHNLYSLPNSIRVIETRRIRRGSMLHAWEILEMHVKFRSEILKGRDHFEDLDVDENRTLKRISEK
jgi:hypothetical protein